MLWPYLRIWDWDLIFGHAVKAISSPGVHSPWYTRFISVLGAQDDGCSSYNVQNKRIKDARNKRRYWQLARQQQHPLPHQEKEGRQSCLKATSIDTIHQSIDIYGVSSLNKLWIIRTFFLQPLSPPLPRRHILWAASNRFQKS